MQELTTLPDSLTTGPLGILAPLLMAAFFFGGVAIDLLLLRRRGELKTGWQSRIAFLRARPWTWHDALLVMASLVMLYGIASALYAIGGETSPDTTADVHPASLIAETLFFQVAGLGVIVILMRRRGFTWRRAFGHEGARFHRDALQGAGFYLAAMPPLAVLSLTYGMILHAAGVPVAPQEAIDIFISPDTALWIKIYLMALAILVAPIVEELCFRGILLPIIARHASPLSSILLVSMLFALIHFHVPSLVPLAGIAAAFSLAYIQTGSLLTPIVMHAIFNAVSLGVLLLFGEMLV